MDPEKEKRFRFQMQYEQEQAQAQGGGELQHPVEQPEPWYQTAANVGLGAMEALYSPLQVAGEAIRGGIEGEPLRVATANNQAGFRAPSIAQRLIPGLRTDQPPADPFVKSYQGLEGIIHLPAGIQNASSVVTGPPDAAANIGGLLMGIFAGPAGNPWSGLNVARKTLFAPKIPVNRMAAVDAARKAGVPLSRAEQTGGKFITGAENFVEKTPMGSSTMGKARAESDSAMLAYKDRLLGKMGTAKESWDVGYQAKPAMASRDSAMNIKRQEMFNAIPEDVHVPLSKARNTADQIIQEQSQYLPTTRNGDVIAIAKDVQNAHEGISSGAGVTGGPSKFGEKISVSPEEVLSPKSNYQLLKRLRETLAGKAKETRNSGSYSAERDYLRLKSSVDEDINSYVKNQKTPLGSMIGQEFADTYQKANAFSGAYKNLFKGDLAAKLENAPPEKILGMVFQKNNETAIKEFRALVGEDGFQLAKKKWISDLLESPNVSQALSDKKIDPGTLNAILSKPEQEALFKYGSVQNLRKTVGNLQGSQGSARTNIQAGSYGVGISAFASLLRGDLKTAGVLGSAFLGPYPASKLLTSKMATQGLSVSVPTGIPMPIREAALASFVDRITTKQGQEKR